VNEGYEHETKEEEIEIEQTTKRAESAKENYTT